MSVPHRIGAAFCRLGDTSDTEAARVPGHKYNPTNKADADKGLANEGDLTPAREGYGGGANSYFTKYPSFLVTKAKGTNIGPSTELPIVRVYLQPYRNFWDCNVVDERTEIAAYIASDPNNLGDPGELYANTTGAGKGELVRQTLTVYWDQAPPQYTDTTEAELAEYPVYLPLAAGEQSNFYAEDIRLYPRGDFQPWRWGYLRGYIVKGDMLCSLSARNIRLDLLGIRAFAPDESGQFLQLLWQPSLANTDGIYYYNTSTWRVNFKADVCCWNEGYKVSGKVKISKLPLNFRPNPINPPGSPYLNTSPDNQIFGWYQFWGNVFAVDETIEPQPYAEIPWELTIDETTGDGEEQIALEFDIPQETNGTIKEVYFISGFTVDSVEPPPPPA